MSRTAIRSPGGPVARPRSPLPAQRQVMMIRDARRHVDLNRLLALHAPVAAAPQARAMDDAALPGARRAGRHGQELPEQRLRLAPHFPAAAAGPARHGLRPGFGARALALRAGVETLDAHRLGRAARALGERQLQADLDVVSAPAVAPRAAAEEAIECKTCRTSRTSTTPEAAG